MSWMDDKGKEARATSTNCFDSDEVSTLVCMDDEIDVLLENVDAQ